MHGNEKVVPKYLKCICVAWRAILAPLRAFYNQNQGSDWQSHIRRIATDTTLSLPYDSLSCDWLCVRLWENGCVQGV